MMIHVYKKDNLPKVSIELLGNFNILNNCTFIKSEKIYFFDIQLLPYYLIIY